MSISVDYLIILSPVEHIAITVPVMNKCVVVGGEWAEESLICSSLHMAIGKKVVLEFA